MKERVVRFGSASVLIGVVTEPLASVRKAGAPAVVFLNSGLLHRVGGSRMHVRMARMLAERGYLCLRFDYAGLGDSEPRKDALPFEQSGVLETREAMEQLAAKGATRFVLVGLCSGADMAFYTAIADERVVGIFQMDPFDYHTPRFHFHKYARRFRQKALTLEPWLNILRGRTYFGKWIRNRVVKPAPAAEHAAEEGSELVQSPYDRAFPPRDQVAEGLRVLVNRGVGMYNLFTGGRDHSYQGQYFAAFRDVDFRGLCHEVYRPETDHLVTDLRHQRWLDAELAAWIDAIPATTPADPAAASSAGRDRSPVLT